MALLTTIFLAFFIVIAILWSYYENKSNKTIIAEVIQKKGGTDIVITREWFTGDRDTLTYSVEYTNSQGQRQYNSCKIQAFFGGDIYWRDPL